MAKDKTCKACKHKFTPLKPLQYVCDWQCAIAYANTLAEKNKRAEAIKSRRETKEKLAKLKTRQEYLKDAQRFFNLFIRLRDAASPCISCQRFHTGQYHAGHFRSVGASGALRFNENNVHKQCSACNHFRSGDIVNYRINLINKIGLTQVEALENNNEPKHYTIDEIKQIKVTYKQKIKELSQ